MAKRKTFLAQSRESDNLAAAIVRSMTRDKEILTVYRPGNPNQDRIHRSPASTLVIGGGNRCLAGEQQIYDPVDGEWKEVSRIAGAFHVLSMNPETGEMEVAEARRPFTKGTDDLYKVTFDDGTTLSCSMKHRLLCRDGEWRELCACVSQRVPLVRPLCNDFPAFSRECHASSGVAASRSRKVHASLQCREQPSGTGNPQSWRPRLSGRYSPGQWPSLVSTTSVVYPSIQISDGCRLTETQRDWLDRYLQDSHPCGGQSHVGEVLVQGAARRQVDALEYSRLNSRSDDSGCKRECSHSCLLSVHLSSKNVSRRSVVQSSAQVSRSDEATYLPSDWHTPVRQQCHCTSAEGLDTEQEAILDQLSFESSHPLRFNVAAHQCTYISTVEYLRQDVIWDIEVIGGHANYWTGVVNANSGKSVCGFTEFVSRVTGEPVFGMDNKPIPSRFYKAKEGDITRYWLVGYNLDHIGQTFYRMLFEPGMGGTFTVIYDPNEGRYVKWNENIPYHRENIDRRELSEPLIPSRLIREESWTWNPYGGGQAKKCFSSVELTNGAILYAFPSTTPQPKQGDPIHGLLIDEDVATGGHVSEYLARLGDHSGWAIWPAWPHDENHVLSSLIDGCKLSMEKGDPRFEYILLTTLENPFFTDKAIQLAMDRMRMVGDEEMVESRIFGIQGHETRKMYDFHFKRHGISGHLATRSVPDLPTTSRRGVLQDIYRRNGKFPDTWTRYLSVDPSTQRAAVLFGVVPPPEVNGVKMPPTLIIEHELIQRRSTPKGLALGTREIVGARNYEAFIMDKNFGRQRHWAAEGVATVEVLASEFRQLGLRSRSTNEWFVMGCNKPQDRYSAVRELLYADEECPAMYFLIDNTPETQKEFDRYYKKQTEFKGMTVVEDEPENPRKFDCMAALEYLTHHFWTMMQVGRHFINPAAYGQDDTMAQVALAITSHDEHKTDYIHLGPGTKA